MKKLFILISGTAILISTFFLGSIFSKHFLHEKIKNSRVEVYPIEKNFIQAEEVEKLLKLKDSINHNINIGRLENELAKNDYINNAEIYEDLNGNLITEVYQYQPIARVFGSTSYYIDNKGKKRPLSSHYTENVILVFGDFDTKKRQDIFTLLQQINGDKYLSNVVAEIHVIDAAYMLKLKKIKAEFKFGNLEKIENKLFKLKTIYTYLIKHKMESKYKHIDLCYSNQVVCK